MRFRHLEKKIQKDNSRADLSEGELSHCATLTLSRFDQKTKTNGFPEAYFFSHLPEVVIHYRLYRCKNWAINSQQSIHS